MSGFNQDPTPFINQNYSTGGTGPFVSPVTTIGTSSVQVVGQQANRQSITFMNPSASATIAFCPARDTNGTAVSAAINGSGSFTLLPYGEKTVVGPCGCAWNAIASAPSSPITVWTSF